MASLVEEVAAELSEAELAQLDALVDEDEPEPDDGAEPATSTADGAPAAEEREQPDPVQAAREFLGATDGALWRLAERSTPIEENASFDALVLAREQALAR